MLKLFRKNYLYLAGLCLQKQFGLPRELRRIIKILVKHSDVKFRFFVMLFCIWLYLF